MKNKVSQKDKARIRKSKEWKQLREDVASKFDNKDPITNEPLRKGFNLHHVCLDPNKYDDFSLVDDFGIPRFLPLNRTTHDLIHSFFRSATRKKNPRNLEKFFANMLLRLREMIALNK